MSDRRKEVVQENRARDAVAVVIGIDGDPLAVGNSAENALDRAFHIGQQERVVPAGHVIRREEGACGGIIVYAAVVEKLGRDTVE